MKKVFKYDIPDLAIREIDLPEGAEILTVQMQGGMPRLWALVDPSAPKESRPILITGTGHTLIENIDRYISTFQMKNGELVFHVFEA